MTPEKLYDVLAQYAASQGIELNQDRSLTLDILTGLLRNEERYGSGLALVGSPAAARNRIGISSVPAYTGTPTLRSTAAAIVPCMFHMTGMHHLRRIRLCLNADH